jgi:hypothetical protein
MALSDELSKLSVRAKQAEDRTAAARTTTEDDLQKQVSDARASAQAQAKALKDSAESGKTKVSAGWDKVRKSWNDHVAGARKSVDDKSAAHDLKSAQKAADQADKDAAFAIAYAYAAIDEAEYTVLDATLAHMRADDLAKR